MKKFNPLSEQEITEINQAIDAAEKNTSAEIVPILVQKVKNEQVSMLKISIKVYITVCFFSLFVGTISVAQLNVVYYILCGLSLFFATFLVFKAESKISKLVKDGVLSQAELEFEKHGISETIFSNGILLFISLEDKQVVVLADEKIRESYPDTTWINVVSHFTNNIKNQSLKDSIVGTIGVLGGICSTVCPKTNTDLNEIKNEIRIKN